MVRLDPNYKALAKGLADHRAATGPDLIRWCPCGYHLAGQNGLCPICEDEKASDL